MSCNCWTHTLMSRGKLRCKSQSIAPNAANIQTGCPHSGEYCDICWAGTWTTEGRRSHECSGSTAVGIPRFSAQGGRAIRADNRAETYAPAVVQIAELSFPHGP